MSALVRLIAWLALVAVWQQARAGDLLATRMDVLREAATLLQRKEVIPGAEVAGIRTPHTPSRAAS